MKHLVGVICLGTCAVCISLSSVFSSETASKELTQAIQPWMPVVLALIAPFGFATSNLQSKYLATQKGFDPSKLTFGAFGLVGFFLSFFLLAEVLQNGINIRFLILGIFGSILNTVGLVFISKACACGPIGPVISLVNMNTILFSMVEAIRFMKMPLTFEIIGLCIGFFGALVLTIPDQMEKAFRCLTCRS